LTHPALAVLCGTLIDGISLHPRQDVTLLIQAGKITQILPQNTPLDNREEIETMDAHDRFVIPGLWDTHVHLGGSAGGSSLAEEFSAKQLEQNLQAYLFNGVTSVLDLGGVQELLSRWQRLEREQKLIAPRIFSVGPLFTAPGGHPSGTLYLGNRFVSENVICQVGTVEAAQTKVRTLILDHQVDAVKVVYDDVQGQKPKLSLAVLRAILVKAGYSTMEAIHVATRVAAEKLGVGKVLGTLEVGKDADLVVLAASPLDDIRNARKIEWVIKRGPIKEMKCKQNGTIKKRWAFILTTLMSKQYYTIATISVGLYCE